MDFLKTKFPKLFPRNYRIITEDKFFWISMSCTILLIGIIYASINLSEALKIKKENDIKRAQTISEISHWEKIVEQHPNYRDAYFKLSMLEYEIGDKEDSAKYLEKALQIDPQFKEGREFEEILYEEGT